MAKVGIWEAKNGPSEPPFWPRIWWTRNIAPPIVKKSCPDDTITQNFTPIVGIVAVTSVPEEKNSSKVQHIWLPAPAALLVVSHAVRAAWLRWSASLGSRPRLAGSLCQVILAYALRSNSRVGTEGSTVSCLINDPWLMLGLETLSINRCLNHW